MEINKPVTPFDDRMDTSRNNPERKPWGKGTDATGLNLDSEYKVSITEVKPAETSAPPQKFTHKLANGTVLEAGTIEELAGLIEKSFQQAPTPPLDFEDKPLYQPYEFKRKELTLAEQAEILNVWKENPQKAMRMLQEADLGAPVEVLIQKLTETQTLLRIRAEEEAGAEFVGDVEDYNPTATNAKKLTDYLREKGKPITKNNLTVAFRQLVAAGDKNLVRKVEAQPEAPEPGVTEPPEPPTVVPSNQGSIETPAQSTLDVAKFQSMTLDQQKKFFSDLRRRQ